MLPLHDGQQAGVPKTRAKKAIQAVVSGDGVVQESPEMTRHILRGHYPYDPNCIECAQGRGVGRSPRRPRRERILEIQADFFFLGRVSDKYKFFQVCSVRLRLGPMSTLQRSFPLKGVPRMNGVP